MAEFSEGVIMEGFLCPICHIDMRSSKILLQHFQEKHSEEQDILSSLKELVGKAKNKILKLDDRDLESFKNELTLDHYYLEKSIPQDPGVTTSHLDYFREIRRKRVDHRTSETNKLIIRLDRYLRGECRTKKKIHEELVPWLDGTTVTRCPSCTVSFNIARRQHHCRLCGSIMCNSCSDFLTQQTAWEIIAPNYSEKSLEHKEDSNTLRICLHCKDMLECRRNVQLSQNLQLPICKLYKCLQKIKLDLQPNLDLYNKMYTSLIYGDSTYQLQDAQSLKSSIAHQAELLDAYSKQIANLPPDPENPQVLILQTAIRRGISFYIKDHLLTLPILPSPAELDKIKQDQTQRTFDLQPKISTPITKVAVTTGWSPAVGPVAESNEDPLIEQMNIVKSYIEQAKKANRFEEVVSLRENLEMLKRMYREKQMEERSEGS